MNKYDEIRFSCLNTFMYGILSIAVIIALLTQVNLSYFTFDKDVKPF